MQQRLDNIYRIGIVFSLIFTLIGFSYNVWRMEKTEYNSNIRTACFEILKELATIERIVYAIHYDKTASNGTVRDAWVAVGLIEDMNKITNNQLAKPTKKLKTVWNDNWQQLQNNQLAANKIVASSDEVRNAVHTLLHNLN